MDDRYGLGGGQEFGQGYLNKVASDYKTIGSQIQQPVYEFGKGAQDEMALKAGLGGGNTSGGGLSNTGLAAITSGIELAGTGAMIGAEFGARRKDAETQGQIEKIQQERQILDDAEAKRQKMIARDIADRNHNLDVARQSYFERMTLAKDDLQKELRRLADKEQSLIDYKTKIMRQQGSAGNTRG